MTEWKLIVFHEDDEKDPEICIFDDFNKLCNFLKTVPKHFRMRPKFAYMKPWNPC